MSLVTPAKAPETVSARLLSLALLAATGVAGAIVLLLAAKPGRTSAVVPWRSPLPYVVVGLACAFGYYCLRVGKNHGRADWLRFFALVLLATVSGTISFVVAEVGIRMALAQRLGANRIERLKDYSEGRARVSSTHPLAVIIEPSADPSLVFQLQPNLEMDFGHRRLHTNADGMRSLVDYPRERAPGTVRIAGLGDSGMFGWAMEQGEDYMTVLEQQLNARGDSVRYEVLNLAVPGYNTVLEVQMLRSKGLAYAPDVVVLGWCENDFDPAFFVLPKADFRRLDVSFVYTLLFDRPRLTTLLQSAPRDLRSFPGKDVPSTFTGAGGKTEVQQALAELKKLSEANGFQVLVFGPIRRDIVPILQNVGLEYYSTYEQIPPESVPKEWAVHAMHPRKEGHTLLAERLAETLDARGWLKPRQR